MAQHVHLPNYATLPQCRLLAIAERRPQLALAVARRFAVERIYSNHLELAADPQIDAVGVSANYAQQGEIAADLLRAGKHVFMEKPMAISVLQAEKILEAAHQGQARLMVAFMKRFDPGNVLARTTIRQWRDDGTKGRLLYARNHGFQGHWRNGLSQSEPFTNTGEPIEGGWIRLAAPRFFAKSEYSTVEIYEAMPVPRYSYPVVSSEHDWNYRAEAAHFLTSLQTGHPFVSSGEDALIDVWLNEQIYKKHLEITACQRS
jgi:predicted dehydrogenase